MRKKISTWESLRMTTQKNSKLRGKRNVENAISLAASPTTAMYENAKLVVVADIKALSVQKFINVICARKVVIVITETLERRKRLARNVTTIYANLKCA